MILTNKAARSKATSLGYISRRLPIIVCVCVCVQYSVHTELGKKRRGRGVVHEQPRGANARSSIKGTAISSVSSVGAFDDDRARFSDLRRSDACLFVHTSTVLSSHSFLRPTLRAARSIPSFYLSVSISARANSQIHVFHLFKTLTDKVSSNSVLRARHAPRALILQIRITFNKVSNYNNSPPKLFLKTKL